MYIHGNKWQDERRSPFEKFKRTIHIATTPYHVTDDEEEEELIYETDT